MKKLFAITAAVALSVAASASAQVTQSSVGGETGNPNYPVQVIGSNGVTYSCQADTQIIDGQTRRVCIRDDDDIGPLFAAGAGLAGGGAIAAGALLLVVLASNDSSSGTTTTTTTTTAGD